MRIVGGKFRGRRLAEPKGQSIRPTTDRNRESLFNILAHSWSDHLSGRVLDVFAGTGALGIEALSRGAISATFLEKSREGVALIKRNIETLNLLDETGVILRDAIRPGDVPLSGPYDLIFADPPYGKNLGEAALQALANANWIAKDALIVLEEKKGCLPSGIPNFSKHDERHFGETSIRFFTYC